MVTAGFDPQRTPLRLQRAAVNVQGAPNLYPDGSVARTLFHEILVWLGDETILSFDLTWHQSGDCWMASFRMDGSIGPFVLADENRFIEAEANRAGSQEPHVAEFLTQNFDPLAAIMLAASGLDAFQSFTRVSAPAMRKFRGRYDGETICRRVARAEENLIDHFVGEVNETLSLQPPFMATEAG